MVSRGKGPPPLKKDKRISAQAQVVFLPDGCAHYTRDPRLGACRLVWAGGEVDCFPRETQLCETFPLLQQFIRKFRT